MSQGSLTVAAIIAAFFVYITAKGELGTYLGFFYQGSGGATSPLAPPNTQTAPGGIIGPGGTSLPPGTIPNVPGSPLLGPQVIP